jgi:hypothetical protein
MKKCITICFVLCTAIILNCSGSVFAYKTLEGGCLSCHSQSTLHNLHNTGAAGTPSCTECHPGVAGAVPIPTSNCIVCHPPANPGQCDLINNSRAGDAHGQTCLACHTDCNPTTTCTYSISPTIKAFRASGGKGAISVAAENGCVWEAISSDPSWIIITSGIGSGSGRARYAVKRNTGTARTGTIDIEGEIFTVEQAGRR